MPLRDPGEVAEERGRAPEFSRQNFSRSGHFDPQTDVRRPTARPGAAWSSSSQHVASWTAGHATTQGSLLGAATGRSAARKCSCSLCVQYPLAPHHSPFPASLQVILDAEYISDHEARVLVAAQQLSVLLGTGLLACLVALRHTQSQLWWLADHALPIINLATGAVCLAALSACWALCGWRFLQARHQHRRW